jgi:hypothetical protein
MPEVRPDVNQAPDRATWEEMQRLIIYRLEQDEKDIRELRDGQIKLRIWAAGAGLVTGGGAVGIVELIKFLADK